MCVPSFPTLSGPNLQGTGPQEVACSIYFYFLVRANCNFHPADFKNQIKYLFILRVRLPPLTTGFGCLKGLLILTPHRYEVAARKSFRVGNAV